MGRGSRLGRSSFVYAVATKAGEEIQDLQVSQLTASLCYSFQRKYLFHVLVFIDPYAGSWTWFEAAIIRGLGGEDFVNEPDAVARQIQGSSVLPPASNAPSDTPDASLGPLQVLHPFNRTRVWMLQRNLRANREEALHEVAWTNADDDSAKKDTNEVLDKSGTGTGYGFVRSLEPGDRIAVYARAQVIFFLAGLST
jgi:hypothetical protein